MIKYLPFEIPVVSFTFAKIFTNDNPRQRRPAKGRVGLEIKLFAAHVILESNEEGEGGASGLLVGSPRGCLLVEYLLGNYFSLRPPEYGIICQGQGN